MVKLYYFTFSSQYVNYFLVIYHLICDPYIGGYSSSSSVINKEAMLVEIEVEIDSFAPVSVAKVWECKDYTVMGLCIVCAHMCATWLHQTMSSNFIYKCNNYINLVCKCIWYTYFVYIYIIIYMYTYKKRCSNQVNINLPIFNNLFNSYYLQNTNGEFTKTCTK